MSLWSRKQGNEASGAISLTPMPIIIGSPRSGTTLLRFMLDSHSHLAIPPETGFLVLAPKLKGEGDRARKRFFDAIVNYPKSLPNWPDFEISEDDFWTTLCQLQPFTASEGFRAFYRTYASRLGKSRWGEKTPLYCRELNVIRKVLPEARFIHLIRDGRDVSLSLRRLWFSPGEDIETQAHFWKDNVSAARKAGLGHSDYIEVHYEELILNTRAVLERICEFVSLSFEESMLRYYERTPARLAEHKGRARADGTVVLTVEQRLHQQRRTTEPPDPSCVFRWKSSMTVEEQIKFERIVGDLLDDLGYEVQNRARAKPV